MRGDPFDYKGREHMNGKLNLSDLNNLAGFVGAVLVDSESGMEMASVGGGNIDLTLAAAGNTEVIRAKRKVMASLGVRDELEDVLISLGNQYHLLRPLETSPDLFLYLVLDRSKANLALARHELKAFEKTLDFS